MAGDYEVGYRKPPKHTRFKPGQSGNSGGRQKGARNLKTELEEELHEMISIKEGGKPKTVSKQRAMLKSLTARAVHGDSRAANVILNLVFKLFHDQEAESKAHDLTEADEAILREYEAKILKTATAKEKNDE